MDGFQSATAVYICLRMIGGIPSPPMALEELSEVRAVKVSSSEILIEQRELSGIVQINWISISPTKKKNRVEELVKEVSFPSCSTR